MRSLGVSGLRSRLWEVVQETDDIRRRRIDAMEIAERDARGKIERSG